MTTLNSSAPTIHVRRPIRRGATSTAPSVDVDDALAQAMQIVLEAVDDASDMSPPQLAELNFARLRQYARAVARVAPAVERIDSALLDGDAF